jgi:probable rRNA maturation factor
MGLVATIDIASRCAGWSRNCPAAERVARDAAEAALLHATTAFGRFWGAPLELGINLTDAAEQQRLNRDYRGQDASTNVLAFPAWETGMLAPPGAPVLLGDVVLAWETVAREAAEHGMPLADHLSHLVVHGVLHLLGYDHLTEGEAAVMEPLETAILAGLGVPDPYRDPRSPLETQPP